MPSNDISFTGQLPKVWLDPLSWSYEDTYLNDASPYVQRVPCTDDHVVFPKVRNVYNIKGRFASFNQEGKYWCVGTHIHHLCDCHWKLCQMTVNRICWLNDFTLVAMPQPHQYLVRCQPLMMKISTKIVYGILADKHHHR